VKLPGASGAIDEAVEQSDAVTWNLLKFQDLISLQDVAPVHVPHMNVDFKGPGAS
jgi:hypothetical protein